MMNSQDNDINLPLNSVHPHQDSSLNHISWHKKERILNFQTECENFNTGVKEKNRSEEKKVTPNWTQKAPPLHI